MKRIMNRIKSNNKATLAQIVVISLCSVMMILAIVGLWVQRSSVDTIYGNAWKKYQGVSKVSTDLNRVHGDLYRSQNNMALNQNVQEMTDATAQQAALLAEDAELVQKILKMDLRPDERKAYQDIQENLLEYQRSVIKAIKLASMGTGTAYLASADDRIKILNQLLTEQSSLNARNASESADTSEWTFYTFLGLFVLLLAAGLLFAFFLRNVIRDFIYVPLKKANGVIRDLAGPGRAHAVDWESKDEVGALVSSVNMLCAKMSGVVSSDAAGSQFGKAKKGAEKDLDSLVISSKDAIDKLRKIS